jgi:hypothetical protein
MAGTSPAITTVFRNREKPFQGFMEPPYFGASQNALACSS